MMLVDYARGATAVEAFYRKRPLSLVDERLRRAIR
jgi:hypothetical protein